MRTEPAVCIIPHPAAVSHAGFTNTRRALCADTVACHGVRSAFDLEMRRLRRLGLKGERQFRLAALNVFGRAV